MQTTLRSILEVLIAGNMDEGQWAFDLWEKEKGGFKALTTMYYGRHSVRSEQYGYNMWEDATQELYDHYADPMEYNNLISDPGYSEVVKELRKYLPKENALPALKNPHWNFSGDEY